MITDLSTLNRNFALVGHPYKLPKFEKMEIKIQFTY